MSEIIPFTIDQFYRFVGERKLMGVRCNDCGLTFIPPRPMCPKCLSKNLSWTQLKNKGKLLTYTVIYVAPKEFQHMAPYAFGIVELEDGVRLPGIIKNVKHEDIRVGMELKVDFDETVQSIWPHWPRYFFKFSP